MQVDNKGVAIVCFSQLDKRQELEVVFPGMELRMVNPIFKQEEYWETLKSVSADIIVLVDGERLTINRLKEIGHQLRNQNWDKTIGYVAERVPKLWLGAIQNLWQADRNILYSPILVGTKKNFLKAYGGGDLAENSLAGIGYSLQKIGGMKFCRLEGENVNRNSASQELNKWKLWVNYSFRLPARYLFSGEFFRQLFAERAKVQRDMVFRMLFILFACFMFIYMPYISKDYGVSGDEFVDHRHAGYVLDYFAKGDKTALDQPKTALHLYGNSVQVIAAAFIRWFNIDNYYEFRHFIGGCVGALGILFAGLMGLRWGGGLCGLISLLMMFFCPRFLGHSMNNLKDIPFAVGYMMSLFYTVRLFDYFPFFRLRHIIGLVLGIALALGTRSGGLILYPMLFMYAGLFYMQYYGVREFYKFRKNADGFGRIIRILMIVIFASYFLSILLWPFALVRPFSGVFYSLAKFTNYNVGLKTIFDGEQMMSNMLPWKYAPKYLCIGIPIVTILGLGGYILYTLFRRKEFSLISFFFLFAAIFPVFWVIYCHSNLYGGIRHLLFVMPPMVVLAGRFWSEMIECVKPYGKGILGLVFLGLLALPVSHMIRNHPNEYVYFNEFKGGLKGAYGDYETDYYFNSLKQTSDWFHQNIQPNLPKDRQILIVTQAIEPVKYYFRKDSNIKVIYSRYYEKYSKDWDYAIFGNVYISQFQLKNHLFPPTGALYTPLVDGFPMSYLLRRSTKDELLGFQNEKEGRYPEALFAFENYVVDHGKNEEVWSKMGKLYYMTGQHQKAKEALKKALGLQPSLNEALYMMTLTNLELKDYPGAFEAVGRMLAENAFSMDAWYLRANIYYQLKQYQNAINDLNKVLAYRPNYDRAHVLAGDIFRDNGNYKQAAAMYERAAKYRNAISTQVQLADMLVRMKNFAQGEEILKKAVEVQASYYPIYKVECRMYLMKGQLREAQECLKVLEQVTDDAEVFVLKALYSEKMNDQKTRQEMLERALRLDPGNPEALNMKKRI